MDIQIRQMDSTSLHQVDCFDRTALVNSHFVLHVEDNKITYSIVSVESYEKSLSFDPMDYATFIDNSRKVIFFADVDGKLVFDFLIRRGARRAQHHCNLNGNMQC